MAESYNAYQEWQNVKMISRIGKTYNDFQDWQNVKMITRIGKM